jgi:hypothetical protein
MKFYSRTDLFTFSFLVILPVLAVLIDLKISMADTIFLGCYFALITILYFGVSYKIQENNLIVTNLYLKTEYSIQDIQDISKVRSFISAPAFSISRIKLTFRDGNYVYISPFDEDDFLKHISSY